MKTSHLLGVLGVLLLSACGTTPKTVEGQKVIGTKWVNGRVVYIVEGNKEVMQRTAAEMRSNTAGTVIAPLPAPAAASDKATQ